MNVKIIRISATIISLGKRHLLTVAYNLDFFSWISFFNVLSEMLLHISKSVKLYKSRHAYYKV